MKERPILFSAPMVRAILEGRKTQTRRAVKLPFGRGMLTQDVWRPFHPDSEHDREVMPLWCPYGVHGDRLWVRETWARTWGEDDAPLGSVIYRADIPNWAEERNVRRLAKGLAAQNPWKPSIHMPRWASRITLEVTGVRVERLQDISEADAKAEGVDPWSLPEDVMMRTPGPEAYRRTFERLWNEIHQDRASRWFRKGSHSIRSPWVWVIEFKRLEAKTEAA